ncbi:MAG: hypothetical protein PHT88_04600 [Candidatus Moranbacteria bacterium]|nr:hypothetical protein [Candidatus Moranbacteria bacterium]
MTFFPFDTWKQFKKLTDAGFTEAQAQALVEQRLDHIERRLELND